MEGWVWKGVCGGAGVEERGVNSNSQRNRDSEPAWGWMWGWGAQQSEEEPLNLLTTRGLGAVPCGCDTAHATHVIALPTPALY